MVLNRVAYSIACFCTALLSITWRCKALHSTTWWHSTTLHDIIWMGTALHSITLCVGFIRLSDVTCSYWRAERGISISTFSSLSGPSSIISNHLNYDQYYQQNMHWPNKGRAIFGQLTPLSRSPNTVWQNLTWNYQYLSKQKISVYRANTKYFPPQIISPFPSNQIFGLPHQKLSIKKCHVEV